MPRDRGERNAVGWRRVSLTDRLRYRFDLLLAHGTWTVLVLVAAATLLIILLSTLILTVAEVGFTSGTEESVAESFWQSLLRSIDPGTMASDSGWGPRVLSLLVTLSGIFVAGTLIGVIAAGMEKRLDDLRRGRSLVVESGHVVILGWSSRLFVVVEELALAPTQSAIVVLAERDKTEMEEEIRSRVDLRGRRLACRSGDPGNPRDLSTASIESARAIVVLSDEGEDADALVVTRVLGAGRLTEGLSDAPIVAEIQDERIADGLRRSAGPRVHSLVAARAIPNLAAIALRSSGHSKVVAELLTFSNSEIYVAALPELANVEFGALVGSFERCTPLGLITAADEVELNPPPDRPVAPEERVILIAPDRGSIEWSPRDRSPAVRRRLLPADPADPSRSLIIGWNDHVPSMLTVLDEVSAPGSSVLAVVDADLVPEPDIAVPDTSNLAVEVLAVRKPRERVGILYEQAFDSIAIFAYRQSMSAVRADGWTLMTLLWLEQALADRADRPRVIVELLEASHVEIARLSGADDWVLSDALLSRIMAQLADQPERRAILLALFAAAGPFLTFEPAAGLGLSGRVTFDDVVHTAYEQGFLAIGVQHETDTGTSVVLNPSRSDTLELDPDDVIIALR